MTLFVLLAVAVVYISLLGKIAALQKRVSELEARREASLHPHVDIEAASVRAAGPTMAQPGQTAEPTPIPEPECASPEPAAPIFAAAAVDDESVQPDDAVLTPPQAAVPSAWEQTTASVFALIKKNPFATAGVLMMLIGAGFLFSLLAASNILPPVVRIVAVALVGVAVFVFGLRQAPSRTFLGLNLQGGALALEYLCTLWAYQSYHLIGTLAAFACLAGLSTLAFAWSLRTERVLFAFIGLAGALLTPIIASTGAGNFAALTIYAVWVSLLSVGVGLRLRAPSLVSAALAGTSALLGAALRLPSGPVAYTIPALTGMTFAYNAAAIFWTRRSDHLIGFQTASIVSVLTGTSLIMAGFLNAKGGVSSGWCATLLGMTAVAQLVAMQRASLEWKGWLLAIGGGLSLIAIGVGLEGASRAMALAASALGFILIARAIGKAQADAGAALYWAISVLAAYHAWDSGNAGTTALALSALVALGAGYLHKERQIIGLFYVASVPVILDIALLQHEFHDPMRALPWFLLWAVVATFAGRHLRWLHLRLSALWLLPAGLALFVSSNHDTTMSGWNAREFLLGAWLAGSAVLMRLYNRDKDVPYRLDQRALGAATLLIPVLSNIELARAFDMMDFTAQTILSSSILLWAIWSATALLVNYVTRFDWQAVRAGTMAAALIAIGVAVAPSSVLTELSQWIGIALLAIVARQSKDVSRVAVRALRILAGAVLAGSLLRTIGMQYGLEAGALELLFERVMQPWISSLWAAGGMAVVVTASRRQLRPLWVGGGIALALLVAKMLLVDLAALTLIAKVTVFLLVGLAFIGLGYFCPLPPEQGVEE